MIHVVRVSAFATGQLKRVPPRITSKLKAWIHAVEIDGLERVRSIRGYHDEPLKGHRKGQRSIRLSRTYRAIYIIDRSGTVEFVCVEEVHKHDY